MDAKNPSGPRVRVSGKYMVSDQTLEYFTRPDLMVAIMGNDFGASEYG